MKEHKKKVIWFAVSSQPVFRNFFLLPGSVWDMIKKGERGSDEARWIFMAPENLRKKYAGFFDGIPPERAVLTSVLVAPPRGFFQRAFRFFYSYLVYTSTTRLLATMGTRPDEMPAGHRLLAPVKRLISVVFGRSRLMRERCIPFLFSRVFPERPFAPLFDEYPPDLVFVPNLYGWFDTMLCRETRERGTKSVGMTASWDHIDKYFIPFRTDEFLAQNAHIKKAAAALQGYESEAIRIVGYPYFDFLYEFAKHPDRAGLVRALGFPEDARYILYISGSVYCPDEPEVIERMLSWMDGGRFAGDVRLVIRPYLGGRFKDRDFDEKKFAAFASHPRVVMYGRESWVDLESTVFLLRLMRHADVVVSAFSTAALEVALFDRPMIAADFDGSRIRPYHRSVRRFEQFTHFQEVFGTGALRRAQSFEELFRFLDEYLADPARDRDGRASLRKTLCADPDGTSGERVLNILVSQTVDMRRTVSGLRVC